MSDFLFELGVEEVPVSEIKSILNQLKTKIEFLLQEHQVAYSGLETAATNKRFVIYIGQINEKADDKDEQIKGPAKRIAFDQDNQPTIALQKFLEFNRVELADLKELETPKGIYLVIERKTKGLPTVDILREAIPKILMGLNFSKTMVWNASRVNFVRPIKNLLGLLENQLIPLEFGGVHSTYYSYGHILLSDAPLEVKSYRDYCELMEKNFVIIREEERKQKILGEIKDVEEDFQARVRMAPNMLDDFIYNNEYPVVFYGQFDKQYLALPAEIISTFMIKEKKLMPVFDKQGNLMNIFVGVSNIPDETRNVKTGNERVIRATFEDAKFFWDNDRKDDFIALREELNNVTFHKDLGTFYQKTERMAKLVDLLTQETGNNNLTDPLLIAALNCKNDLVTRMVREFPSLQGIMGGLYLKERNIDEITWKAVYGHYEPKGFQPGQLDDFGAGLLSIADKIDNITGFLSKGIKISSSKDPYGVRRDANGIIKIIIDFQLDLDLDKVIQLAASLYDRKKSGEITKKVRELFFSRVENVLKDFLSFRYDVVNAVLGKSDLNIYRIYLKAVDVSKIVKSDSIEDLVTLHKRLKNIVKKAPEYPVTEDALVENEEKLLFEIARKSKDSLKKLMDDYKYLQTCSEILQMKPVIDNFFDKVLVNAEDQKLKENRIGLVQLLDIQLSKIADFSLIVEQ